MKNLREREREREFLDKFITRNIYKLKFRWKSRRWIKNPNKKELENNDSNEKSS